MLNKYARALFTAIFEPIARLLLKWNVSPDVVTVVGTLGVVVGALGWFPRGELLTGTLVITAFVFSDLVDGTMARLSGRTSAWGAFLDSSLDRVADLAIFGGLAWWFITSGQLLDGALCLLCLGLGSVVSYVKARAEGLGFTVSGGIAERADRLVATLVTVGFVGMGLPQVVLTVVLGLLAAASVVTVGQRMSQVWRQAHAQNKGK